jgi:hypothetical protein
MESPAPYTDPIYGSGCILPLNEEEYPYLVLGGYFIVVVSGCKVLQILVRDPLSCRRDCLLFSNGVNARLRIIVYDSSG